MLIRLCDVQNNKMLVQMCRYFEYYYLDVWRTPMAGLAQPQSCKKFVYKADLHHRRSFSTKFDVCAHK